MASAASPSGPRLFAALGRAVVRKPLYPIVAWVILFAVTLPFLSHLGSVTTNSTNTLPSSSPSAQAAAKFADLFPGSGGGASATVVVFGPNVTGPAGQGVVRNASAAIAANTSLRDLVSVDSVYSAYAAYLAGEVRLATGAIVAAQTTVPSLTSSVNGSASLLWGPPALFWANWSARVAHGTGPWSSYNAPAFNATAAALGSNASAQAVLAAFYNGTNGSTTGFNGSSADCAAGPTVPDALACADAAARQNVGPLMPTLLPGAAATALGRAVLGGLGIENASLWPSVQGVAASVLAGPTNFSSSFLRTVWTTFPGAVPAPGPALAWANGSVANRTLATELLPVPLGLRALFVAPAGTASLIQISFSVADDTTDATGAHPVYDDLRTIDGLMPGVLAASDPTRSIRYLPTGPAPLDQLTNDAVSSSLALVLPLTVGLLLAISMVYFRSPLAPLVTFGGLGIALVLGLGGTVLVGTLVTHVDTTALTLEEVFVLGVGTDYSIFLVARYREGLVHGLSSEEAIVASVTWAGQSVATSGSTAILVTVALAFSGVALLSQWGLVLSLAILITMLLSLTLVPACLRLLGPRIFWPTHGARFARHSERVRAKVAAEATYFYRAARATHRRPRLIAGTILLVSIPLVAVALTVPLSYDFYGQLPAGHPATDGLAEVGSAFGPGFAVPSYALVTFAAPLIGAANATNASEFTDLASLTTIAQATPGIAVVRSPVGAYGASLGAWLSLASESASVRANLLGTLAGYLGTDGRTVLVSLEPDAAGLSESAVHAVDATRGAFVTFAAGHPEVAAVSFGGGAPTIEDLAAQTNVATEVMLLAVTIGLVAVLLVVLRSWMIAVMAVTTIGLSIAWAWAITSLVFSGLLGFPIFFYVRTLLFMLVLGLGIDYNIFVLTRVREERFRGRSSEEAAVEAIGRTGGIITAAAVILASAFAALYVGEFTLIRAIGFSVAVAVVLDAMVVRTYLVPSLLQGLGDRVWTLSGRRPRAPPPERPTAPPAPAEPR